MSDKSWHHEYECSLFKNNIPKNKTVFDNKLQRHFLVSSCITEHTMFFLNAWLVAAENETLGGCQFWPVDAQYWMERYDNEIKVKVSLFMYFRPCAHQHHYICTPEWFTGRNNETGDTRNQERNNHLHKPNTKDNRYYKGWTINQQQYIWQFAVDMISNNR